MLVFGALHPGCADILVFHYGCFYCMQFSIEAPSLHHATCIRSWSSPCSGCMRVSASLERARQLAYRLTGLTGSLPLLIPGVSGAPITKASKHAGFWTQT